MTRRLAALALLAGLVLAGCASAAAAEPATDVTITFRYSRFVPAAITVPAGVPVTFTLRNDDPIGHEWIVGTADVHARHRVGTEPYHDERATEVSVPPFASRSTIITFEPGVYAFICHLPGHEAYGMKGTLTVHAR
ncbi:MAG: cupredoxin domain-containing protein [Dehalococcoidia bacterium]